MTANNESTGSAYKTSPAIVFERPRKVSFREIALSPLESGGLIAETTYSAISAGTDMKTWRGQQHPTTVYYPLVPGYENVGRVVQVDSANHDFSIGDRVMINECRFFPEVCAAWGGSSKYTVKDSHTAPSPFDPVAKIPDAVSDEQAVVAYLAAVALKGVERVPLNDGDYVLIIGAGMVGLSALQIVKILNPQVKTICLERLPYRREIAGNFADHVVASDGKEVEAIREITDGRMVDRLIECSGNAAVVGGLHQYLKRGGWGLDDEPAHIHLQGDYPERIVMDSYNNWFTKNCNLSMTCALKPGGKEKILGWIADGQFRTDAMPYEVWPVKKCAEAYEYMDTHRDSVLKILFKWED